MRPRYALRASRYDLRLTKDRPFDAQHLSYAAPTSLQVSIHEGFEVGILLAGGVEITCEGPMQMVRPGDTRLISMWEPHQWRVTSPGTEQIAVIFLPEFLGDELLRNSAWLDVFASPPNRRPRPTGAETRQATLAIGLELRRELQHKRAGWETAVRLAVVRLLFALTRGWQAPPHIGQRPLQQASGLARVMPALAAIHERPVRRVTLVEAAAACGLSIAQFSRVFHHATGLSFAQLQLRSHLAFAAHLLLTTDFPVEEIASRCGFTDRSHFHRHFVRHYDATPNQFREQRQKRP